MKNIFSLMFTLFVMVFMFTACEEKDEQIKPETPTCEVACDEATEACVCKEDKCACEKKEVPAPACEVACDEDKECKCVEAECVCVPKTTEVPKCEDMKCAEDETCKCDDKECKCEKNAEEPELKCEPACEENKECKCVEEKCECVDKVVENVCKDKSEGDECGENKVCMKGEGEELVCMDKPVEEPAPAEPEK